MKANIAAVGLGCPFEIGFNEADSLLNTTVATLTAQGINCANVGVVMHDLETVKEAAKRLRDIDMDVLLICIATWSEDHHLLDLLSYIDKPVILRAFPARDTGSLCCAHQIGAVFTDIGKGYEFVYGDADNVDCATKTKDIATAYALANCMGKVRMGAIGGRVKGMTEIAYDEFSIKQKLGARIVNLDEKEMTEKVAAITDEEAEKLSVSTVCYGSEFSDAEQAEHIFDALRIIDESGAKKVFAHSPKVTGIGLAVYNRLIRAAGFDVIEL